MVSVLLDELTNTKDLEGLPIDVVIKAMAQHTPKPLVLPKPPSYHALLELGITFAPISQSGTFCGFCVSNIPDPPVLYKKKDPRHPSHPQMILRAKDPEKSSLAARPDPYGLSPAH